MDPELQRQKEAFKRRALVVPVIEKRTEPKKKKEEKAHKRKKKKSKFSRPKPQPIPGSSVDQIKQAALVAHRSNNPYRVLKAVVDMMKQRYTSKDYDPLTLEEILTEINLTDLKIDTRQWLQDALTGNAKMQYFPEDERFLFKPTLGLNVRNRRQLLAKLEGYERDGLGGILVSEVKEALHNPEKAIKKLEEEGEIMKLTRPDKEEVVFYNNRDYEIHVDEDFRSLWRSISVDGLGDGDIEKYLQNVGLGAMQGETRKRRAPAQQQKARKKSRLQKVLNTHLDSNLLKDYSEDSAASK